VLRYVSVPPGCCWYNGDSDEGNAFVTTPVAAPCSGLSWRWRPVTIPRRQRCRSRLESFSEVEVSELKFRETCTWTGKVKQRQQQLAVPNIKLKR
jgi:hypothetical protein